jgi:release factor glutamine methyltransferase
MKCQCARNPTVCPRSNQRVNTGTLGAWLQSGQTSLATSGEHLSALYAITESVLAKPASWQIAHPEHPLSEKEEEILVSRLTRLLEGEPLPYITAKQSFFGREFAVNPSVLIPRPETEQLVERAISAAKQKNNSIRIADVGTGSGCIAVTLAKEISHCSVFASDVSGAALSIAAQNAAAYGVSERVSFVQCDLLSAFSGPFDIVCANLPYIPRAALSQLAVTRHEPILALDGGEDGLQVISALLEDLDRIRGPRCSVFCEIEETLATQFIALIHSYFPAASVKIECDLAGRDRIGVVQF